MAVKEGAHFIPGNATELTAFQNQTTNPDYHFETLEDIINFPYGKLQRVAGDYLSAAITFIANKSTNSFLEDAGTETWWTVNRGLQRNMITTCGYDPQDAFQVFLNQVDLKDRDAIVDFHPDDPNMPHVILHQKRVKLEAPDENGKTEVIDEAAQIFITPGYLVMCKYSPLDALLIMSGVCSHIKDYANYKIVEDTERIMREGRGRTSPIHERILAHRAQFLLQVLKRNQNPQFNYFNYSPENLEEDRRMGIANIAGLLQDYPNGIRSLPGALIYKGKFAEPARKEYLKQVAETRRRR